MKIYLSGQISGTELSYTSGLGMWQIRCAPWDTRLPILFVTGCQRLTPWEAHMAKDIIALLQCEGIYMLAGWEENQWARIEHAHLEEIEEFYKEYN